VILPASRIDLSDHQRIATYARTIDLIRKALNKGVCSNFASSIRSPTALPRLIGDLVRAVLVEHDGRTLAHIALLHRLPDFVECHRPVDVDELVVLAQHGEELAEVLVWQYVISNLGLCGQRWVGTTTC